jgi:sugar phosphate isomerase/epimerase
MTRFAVSSWSLDGLLRNGLPVEELPGQLADHDIRLLELCHFHLASRESTYLQAIRRTLQSADVTLFTLLIDTGDLAEPDPDRRRAEVELIAGWIPVASQLGAQRVRISAGRQPPTAEAIERSAAGLNVLQAEATRCGLVAVTENWQTTSEQPESLLEILARCQGRVGLCADTGNAEATPDKYATLAQLLPHATSVHFKARYTAQGDIEQGDAQRCADLMRQAGFDGPITLIYDRKVDEWAGVERLRAALEPLLS